MKKVLIITYYWPPSGGGGVQRWLKFAKYLPQYGVQPIIAAPENAEYPQTDHSLEKDIPKEAEVIKIPIWEPYKLFKLFTGKKQDSKVNSGVIKNKDKQSFAEKLSFWIRGNILIPDPRVFWVKPAYKRLRSYIQKNNIDTIITTGPPHSVHLIGLKLKNKYNVKWLADFRDPWSEIDYLEEFNLGTRAIRKQKELERKVLKSADRIITVSENWAKDLKRLGATNISVITNGFDEDDFKDFDYNYKSNDFTLLYSGIIHAYRNPEFLWDAIDQYCKTNEDFSNKFRLKLFGTIDDVVLKYLSNLPLLKDRYVYGGYISHKELLKEYSKASALLLLQNNTKNALGHIPGKLFEYLACRKPILAVGPHENSDVNKLISNLSSGYFCAFNNTDKLITALQKALLNTNIDNKLAIEVYSRSNLTKKLLQFLK